MKTARFRHIVKQPVGVGVDPGAFGAILQPGAAPGKFGFSTGSGLSLQIDRYGARRYIFPYHTSRQTFVI